MVGLRLPVHLLQVEDLGKRWVGEDVVASLGSTGRSDGSAHPRTIGWVRFVALCLVMRTRLLSMMRAITIRLDEADHAALARQADQLRVRPGTLARMLVHAGLTGDKSALGGSDARAALERLVQRSRRRSPADAVALVNEARADLGADR